MFSLDSEVQTLYFYPGCSNRQNHEKYFNTSENSKYILSLYANLLNE